MSPNMSQFACMLLLVIWNSKNTAYQTFFLTENMWRLVFVVRPPKDRREPRRTEVHSAFEAPMATGDGPWWKCRGALWTDVSGIGIEQPCQGQPCRTPGSLGAFTKYCHSSRERPKNISPKDRPSFRTTVEQAATHRRAMARALLTQAAPLVADATKQGLADLSHAPQTRKFWSWTTRLFFLCMNWMTMMNQYGIMILGCCLSFCETGSNMVKHWNI